MTFPAYITDGALTAQAHPDYGELRLISVVGGTRDEQTKTLKLAALHRVSADLPIAAVRIYTDAPDTWLMTGFTDVESLSTASLANGIGELPTITIIDSLDTTSELLTEIIEHLKASVQPHQLLAVSYAHDHDVAHNADLVHWLGLDTRSRRTG